MARGVIEIVDAAYSAADSDQEWIERVAAAAYAMLDEGLGTGVFTFDASSGDRVRVRLRSERGMLPGFPGSQLSELTRSDHIPILFGSSPPALLLSDCIEPQILEAGYIGQALRPFGIKNMLGIRCADPSGRGCVIAVALPHTRPLPARRRSVLGRVAAHLAAAWRLRERLDGAPESTRVAEGSDAVFSEQGRLEHLAAGLDAERDGAKLRASIARLRAAKEARRLDPDSALELWRALVDGRWSIVQRSDSDGKRFLLARRNAPDVRDIGSLTKREALAAAYAALGHSNKLIAYELGIPESSLSVLLKRAMQKLGAKSRAELALMFGA